MAAEQFSRDVFFVDRKHADDRIAQGSQCIENCRIKKEQVEKGSLARSLMFGHCGFQTTAF